MYDNIYSPFPGLLALGQNIDAYPKVKACAEAVAKLPDVKAFAERGFKKANPVLYYFPFSGRAEVTRLIAAAGGVVLDNQAPPEDRKELCASCGAVGTGIPLLVHGELKMCQSQAIQNYISSIAPKFKDLSPQARAIDMLWCSHGEDMAQDCFKSGVGPLLFAGVKDNFKADELKAALEKWFGVFERLAPEDGFVNKQTYPTGAECVALCYFEAAFPVGAMYKAAGFDKNAYPKLKALAARAAEAPGLKEYIASSTSLKADPSAK